MASYLILSLLCCIALASAIGAGRATCTGSVSGTPSTSSFLTCTGSNMAGSFSIVGGKLVSSDAGAVELLPYGNISSTCPGVGYPAITGCVQLYRTDVTPNVPVGPRSCASAVTGQVSFIADNGAVRYEILPSGATYGPKINVEGPPTNPTSCSVTASYVIVARQSA